MMMTCGPRIACGTYGVIYKANISEQPVAVKEICLRRHSSVFENETFFAFKTKGMKHTIHAIKSFVQGSSGFLVMEYCDTDLMKLCNKLEYLTEEQVIPIFYQICKATQELHSAGIAHLDLKLENILLSQGNVKLCDFGSAAVIDSDGQVLIKERTGSPVYVAPEIKGRKRVTGKKCDIWSLGIILHLLLTGCFPSTQKVVYLSPAELTFEYTSGLSAPARNLLKSLLEFDATKRPTIESVLEHLWLSYSE